ncbi:CZB domain-containing protein [uncultured Herbaspirillum sp.]|jgi:methyl-accepting chemotaxis protein|uniref:CZB domain-containing protein n=1 Tax=uncultured Herbaspirillum sp. TaxID=160236 RepID=UPI00258AF0B2|nr:CZB domain-containing protein [uncultured Herbaspirillum sp.]
MNLADAITKHAGWKVKLRTAIRRKAPVDAASIAQDNCCELGQWLHGEGRIRYGSKPEFEAVVECHKQFHVEAGKVAALINVGQFDEAEKSLGSDGAYNAASNAVCTEILHLRQAVG